MRSFAVWLVIACTFVAVTTETALAQNTVTRVQVDALLGAYEGVEPEQWRGLGAAAAPILESIALDPGALATHRARSLDGLAALGSGEATMRSLANSNAAPLIVRMSAMHGLGQILPEAALIAALRPLLRVPHSQLRGIAAETLSNTPAGCAVVADMAKLETDAWRSRFARSCGGPSGSAPQPTSADVLAATSGTTPRVVVYRVTDPSAVRIYDYPSSSNIAKLLPTTLPGAFSVLLPNSPAIPWSSGAWNYKLLASAPTTADVQALIKSPLAALPASGTLNANLFFVGVPGLSAATAPVDANFQAVLANMNSVYAQIGIQLGTLTYIDITGADATAYTDLVDTDLGNLMKLSSNAQAADGAINLFFVHSITGGSLSGYVILGESAGIPGVPIRGTTGSGVAITMAGYPSGLGDISQTIVHESGHWLGLFHTTESGGTSFDPLADTPQCPKVPNDTNNDGVMQPGECAALDAPNLMFWTGIPALPNTLLTSNQQFVGVRNPVVNVTGTTVSTVPFGQVYVSSSQLTASVTVNVPGDGASVTLFGVVAPPPPPAVRTVNSIADTTDGVCDATNCTLREALGAANSGDSIVFSSLFATPQTINLGSALPNIHADLTITGPGANLLTVRANASGFSVFSVNSGSVAISGLTIANGTGNGGSGGGIINVGTLLLQDSVLSGNHGINTGGGIHNLGTLTVLRSTIVGNDAGFGGGLSNFGTASLVNTTLSGNSAITSGKAIYNYNNFGAAKTVQLLNCTIADHFGAAPSTVISLDSGGPATISVRNTLFAHNAGASLATIGATAQITSLGNNLASDAGGSFLTGTGDLISTDPLLAAALGNYGGHTPTYLLARNSPAFGAGSLADGAPLEDQRGAPRLHGDIGAVELNPRLITSAGDAGDGTCDSSCTLRDAITSAFNDGSAVHDLFFDATFNTPQTINLTAVLPSITKDLTINGPGANLLTVRRDTGGDYRIFTINPGAAASLSGLTIANGKNGFGGGIANYAWLTVDRCTLTGNLATSNGGAMQNTGVLVMMNSTLSGNAAATAGGLLNYALSGPACAGCSASLTNTTVSGNTATSFGGGVINRNYGGTDPTLTLTNSTVAGNSEPGVLAYGEGTIYLQNTIVTNNQTQDLADFGTNPHVLSLGHNITGGDGGGYFTVPGDLINTDPLLATLGNYGGPTPTLYLKPGSPAIDAGADYAAPHTDQRGVLRPIGAHVDMGAVESDGLLIFQNGFD
jgi:CSLREA domain-containing protein